jgi:hypothetical protein
MRCANTAPKALRSPPPVGVTWQAAVHREVGLGASDGSQAQAEEQDHEQALHG